MNVNMFVTQDHPFKEVKVGAYLADSMIPPDDFYRIIKGVEWKLFNKGFCATSYREKIYFFENGSHPPETLEIHNYKFNLMEDPVILNVLEHKSILCGLVESAIKHKVFSLGFERPEGQKYYKKIPYKEKFFSFYEAFYCEVEILDDGEVGIWIDPTTKWKFELISFLKWVKGNQTVDVEKYLLERKVKYPSVSKNKKYPGKIVKISTDSIQNSTFKNSSGELISVYQYWKKSDPHSRWLQRNNIKLDPNEKPTVFVQISKNSNPLPYPPSVLEIVIDILDPIIPNEVFQEKKFLSPTARLKETFELFDLLLGNGLQVGNINLIFERKLYSLTQNRHNYGSTFRLQAPALQFGNNGICTPPNPWSDPDIKNAIFQYGPVTVKKTIPISYIIPENQTDNIEVFNNYLNKHSMKLKLGTFTQSNCYSIDKLTPDRYLRICQQLGQEITEGVAFVLLPNIKPTDAYYSAKRGLGRNQIISEMVQWNTFMDILKASSRGGYSFSLYNIALKAYGRYLKCSEAIWHLKNPAGGLDPNKNAYFMGFDVSRNPDTRKESAAYAAVCDSLGRILYRNTIDTHRGEKVIAEVLSDWFFDLAINTYDEVGSNRPLDLIYLFKDGPIYPSEINEYQKGSLMAKERLIQENIMTKNSDVKVIAAIKRGLHRFYGEEKFNYKVNYSGLIKNSKEAIIVTSRPRMGTASTMRLNLAYQINNDMDIEQIVRIFNDLRYLDWNSLFMQPKTILPLHIVQNLAKLTKEDIIVPYDPR